MEIILTPLAKMASVTKTIMVEQSQDTIRVMLEKTSVLAKVILPFLDSQADDKTFRARSHAPVHLKTWLDTHGIRAKAAIEAAGGLAVIEGMLGRTLVDAVPSVKENARLAFWAFASVWPAGGKRVTDKLDAQARKALDKVKPSTGTTPNPKTVAPVAGGGTAPKRTGMSALIAARRAAVAKEREIQATAEEQTPPTSIPLPPSSPPPAPSPTASDSRPRSSPSPVNLSAPSLARLSLSDDTGEGFFTGTETVTPQKPSGRVSLPAMPDSPAGTPPRSQPSDTNHHVPSSTSGAESGTNPGSLTSMVGQSSGPGQLSPPQTPLANPSSRILQSVAQFEDSPQPIRSRITDGRSLLLGSPRHSDILTKGKAPATGGWERKLSREQRSSHRPVGPGLSSEIAESVLAVCHSPSHRVGSRKFAPVIGLRYLCSGRARVRLARR